MTLNAKSIRQDRPPHSSENSRGFAPCLLPLTSVKQAYGICQIRTNDHPAITGTLAKPRFCL